MSNYSNERELVPSWGWRTWTGKAEYACAQALAWETVWVAMTFPDINKNIETTV